MSNDTLMNPREFADRLERSFGIEPAHADPADDLAHGRRRLRRRRAGTAVAALAVLGIVSAGASAAPGLLPHQAREAGPAAGQQAVTDSEAVRDCLEVNDRVSVGGRDHVVTRQELLHRMGTPRLMTRADTGDTTLATLRAQDGAAWLECRLSRRDPALKVITLLYPTAVRFPRATVGGVRAYAPRLESDPRLSGTATAPVPQFAVTCDVREGEESAAWYRAAAACPTYTLTWNDRRPDQVAGIRVTAPDGRVLDADVKDGYVSLAYTGEMTPAVAERVAAGEMPGAARITFYDTDGKVLVDDRDPGHTPTDGSLSIANFPSLAWWTR